MNASSQSNRRFFTHRFGLLALLVAAAGLAAGEPEVTIQSPADQAHFTAPATIVVEATAIDADGYAPRAELVVGDSVKAVSEIVFIRAPDPGTPIQHQLTWSHVPAGDYTYRVRAMDDSGMVGVSAPRHVVVAPPPAEVSVRFVTPVANQEVLVGAPVAVTVEVIDPEHRAYGILVWADGRHWGGQFDGVTNRVTFTNSFRFPGEFELTATALSVAGVQFSSMPVVVRAVLENAAPYVRIVNPERRANLPGVRSLMVEARAGDGDGTVRSVEFYVGTNRVGVVEAPVEGTTNLYRLGTADVSPGVMVLRAVAVDNDGARSWSAPVPIYNGVPLPPLPGIQLAEQPMTWGSYALGAHGVLFQWDYALPNDATVTSPIPATLPADAGPLMAFASGRTGMSPVLEGVGLETGGQALRWLDRYLSPGRVPLPEGVSRWGDVAAGAYRQFAVGDNGQLYAWGNNSAGGLGLGTNTSNLGVVTQATRVFKPEGVRAWKQVSATAHTLALDADGRLFAWGENLAGQAGVGGVDLGLVRIPTRVAGPADVTWKAIAAGGQHSLALTAAGELYAWGNNEGGQLGVGRLHPTVRSPMRVPLPAGALRWTRIAAGAEHSLAATDDGSVYAWGRNSQGQVAYFADQPEPWPGVFLPRRVEWAEGVSEWLTFTGGSAHSLAVGDDGRIYRWGRPGFEGGSRQMRRVTGATPEILWALTNQPPTVALTADRTNGAVVPLNTTVVLRAEAADPDSAVVRVDFFDGAILLGSDPARPYERSVSLHSVGRHAMRARAVDAQGAATWSDTWALDVGEGSNQLPVVHISNPTNGAVFHQPAVIELVALAEDPDGLVATVAFYAGEVLLGTVTNTSNLSGPFVFRWSHPPLGEHALSALATDNRGGSARSQPVGIVVRPPPPDGVVVTVETSDLEASESGPNPGAFTFKRTGEATTAMEVRFQFLLSMIPESPSAINGVDFVRVPESILMPAGASTARLVIEPIDDELPEWDEQVALRILPGEGYQANTNAVAHLVIVDNDRQTNHPPTVRLVAPLDGTVMSAPTNIMLVASAQDLDGFLTILDVTFYDGTIALAVVTNRVTLDPLGPFFYVWPEVPTGVHELSAVVRDNRGATGRSHAIRLTVGAVAGGFVRDLPELFVPGETVKVLISAQPPANAIAWALEDKPPAGWAVTNVSDEGVFDPVKGKVKFGPFFQDAARALSYELLAPVTATNAVEFAGTASVEGVNEPVTGDRILRPGTTRHPADRTPGDFEMVLSEVTAYAAAWREGANWPAGPVPIPVDYVTRVGLLWRMGESYHFDGGAGAPPLCWVPNADHGRTNEGGLDGPARGLASRSLPATGLGLASLSVQPQLGVSSYAVEEELPAAMAVSAISHEGTLDPGSRRIRWGPFLDDLPRTLTYALSATSGTVGTMAWGGRASFDGRSVEVGGGAWILPEAGTRPWLVAERVGAGMDLLVFGGAGRSCVVEMSSDGVQWEPLETFSTSAEPHRYGLGASAGAAQRFYRVRVE